MEEFQGVNMAEAKIIKLPEGEAFIEIGTDYVRIGAGSETFLILDKNALNAGAQTVNWQISPSQMTYQGFLTNMNPLMGLIPQALNYGSSTYSFSGAPVASLMNILVTNALVSSAVGII